MSTKKIEKWSRKKLIRKYKQLLAKFNTEVPHKNLTIVGDITLRHTYPDPDKPGFR